MDPGRARNRVAEYRINPLRADQSLVVVDLKQNLFDQFWDRENVSMRAFRRVVCNMGVGMCFPAKCERCSSPKVGMNERRLYGLKSTRSFLLSLLSCRTGMRQTPMIVALHSFNLSSNRSSVLRYRCFPRVESASLAPPQRLEDCKLSSGSLSNVLSFARDRGHLTGKLFACEYPYPVFHLPALASAVSQSFSIVR